MQCGGHGRRLGIRTGQSPDATKQVEGDPGSHVADTPLLRMPFSRASTGVRREPRNQPGDITTRDLDMVDFDIFELRASQAVIPVAYRDILRDRRSRRFLGGLGVSSLGDGMSIVTIAWLAVRIAPAHQLGLFVGLAVAAYFLPGSIGAPLLGRYLHSRPAREIVLAHCACRGTFLALIASLAATGHLTAPTYVVLLAGSSLLAAWGTAGEYTLLARIGGHDGGLAANGLANAQGSLAVIVGPALAGILLTLVGPSWLLALDAASFAYLGLETWRTSTPAEPTSGPLDPQVAKSGLQLLRQAGLLSLIVVNLLFSFLYGPVEDALPVYVAHDLHAHARLLGIYWAGFGLGALISSLATGALRHQNIRRAALIMIAGWGLCLIPFAFAPTVVTVICFAFGGIIYGPFVPLTYTLLQASTSTGNLPRVLATRSAVIMTAFPLGTAIGGPLVAALGAKQTLTTCGAATILLAAIATVMWPHGKEGSAMNRVAPGRRPARAGRMERPR